MKSITVKHKRYGHKLKADINSEFKLIVFMQWLNENSNNYIIDSACGDKLVDYKVIDGLVYTNIDPKRSINSDVEFDEVKE